MKLDPSFSTWTTREKVFASVALAGILSTVYLSYNKEPKQAGETVETLQPAPLVEVTPYFQLPLEETIVAVREPYLDLSSPRLNPPTLESLADAQTWVSNTIEYVSTNSFVYSDTSPTTFMPVPRILEKRAGNCKEGFILMAAALLQLGYGDKHGNVYGLAVYPEKGAGHIVAMYQDKPTGKWGTAGISNDDFIPPVYDTVEALAEDIALQHGWTKTSVTQFTVNQESGLETRIEPLELPSVALLGVDLQQKYGLVFEEDEQTNGSTIKREILKDGYRISMNNIILIPDKEIGRIKGKIDGLYVTGYMNEKEAKTQVSIDYADKLTVNTSVNVYFTLSGKARSIQFSSFDDAMLEYKSNSYFLENGCYVDTKTNKVLPKEEAAAYIQLARSVMGALGQKYAHQMFKQQQQLRDRKLLLDTE